MLMLYFCHLTSFIGEQRESEYSMFFRSADIYSLISLDYDHSWKYWEHLKIWCFKSLILKVNTL